MTRIKLFYISITLLVVSCTTSKLPTERLSQYNLNYVAQFEKGELIVHLENTLRCPVRIWVQPTDTDLYNHFSTINPITLPPLADTTFQIKSNSHTSQEVQFASRLGDINQIVNTKKVALPFPTNNKYTLVQGYNSTPTHNTDWSRYALDFSLVVGDTICAATDGYVVGVIDDYKYGGEGKEWRNFGNFVTIYDPTTGLFTQYAHLVQNGSLVSVGDKVTIGQTIALSGMTGQTNIEHLHFNCLQPNVSNAGLISIPMDSIGNYRISDIQRDQVVEHN